MDTLLLGGAGFIGSNLAHRLVREGHDVTVVDSLLTGHPDNVPAEATFLQADARDPEVLASLGTDWDAVFHFGGASSAPLFDERPEHAHEALQVFQNVLELARRSGAPVAFASTSSMYSGCPKPYREDMQVTPTTLYEFSKLSMEQLARAYAARYGVDVTAFRFFSVYGPREQGKGRLANLVSQFLWCLRSGIPPLVYGDGSQTRDFTYVDDLLDALLLAYPATEGFDVYNIGTGVEHTFNQLLEKLRQATGIDLDAHYIDNPIANYVQETQADASRLRALGWRPRVDLDEGIRRLVRDETPLRPETVEAMRGAHGIPGVRHPVATKAT